MTNSCDNTANNTINLFSDLPVLFDSLNLNKLADDVQQRIAQVDACLPQTQCGLCEHPDGCLPYATAIVMQGEAHNKCVPGGQPVCDAIAAITDREPLSATSSKWEVDSTSQRPTEVRAIIREEDCIGCTKCIPACPVDAIVGTGKHMHTIFTDLCTGCELCLPPCPVDCIDLVTIARTITQSERLIEQNNLRERYYNHLDRVASQMQDSTNARPVISMVETKVGNATRAAMPINAIDENTAKATIQAAKLRTKIKKLKKQLSMRPSAAKQSELDALQNQLQLLTDSPLISD